MPGRPFFMALLCALGSAACAYSEGSSELVAPRVAEAPLFNPPPPPRAPPPPPAPAPPPDLRTANPEARRLFLAHAGQPSTALVVRPAPEVTRMALENTARGEAPGMTPETPVLLTILTEGQRASIPVALPPGACATYVAEGGLGIIEVDLFLTRGVAPGLEVLAEDPTSGPIAVIGGRDGCFRNGSGSELSADLQVHARKGSGVVLVRAFRK